MNTFSGMNWGIGGYNLTCFYVIGTYRFLILKHGPHVSLDLQYTIDKSCFGRKLIKNGRTVHNTMIWT
jgi:hypothetical protein